MNNERVELLLRYMNGLGVLSDASYRCNTEIAECIVWLREEFDKESDYKVIDKEKLTVNIMKAKDRELIASVSLDGEPNICHNDYLIEVKRHD